MKVPKKFAIAKPRRLQKNEIELLKRTVAKGVTDDEFALFLWVAKKHKIDPMTRQLHCIKRFTNKHHQDEKGIWVGGFTMSIQIGIDGYRALAGRDHADFGGCDEPEFVFGESKRIPEKATIRLWKKGLEHPIIGVAYWDEYAPKDLMKPEAFMWAKMPKHMLAKCAEALALRKGYPELADIYTNEEMAQTADEYTPEGRRYIDAQPVTGSHEAAQEVARQKIAEHAKVLEARKLEEAAKTKSKRKPPEKPAPVASQEEIWPKSAKHSTERVVTNGK
jgi:phage recombination protein Bet